MAHGTMAAERQIRGVTIIPRGEAVEVDIVFYMPKPASAPKKWVPMVKRPDIDKLGRAVLDALTDVVFEDDSQVTDLLLHKRYISEEHPDPGAQITVCTN